MIMRSYIVWLVPAAVMLVGFGRVPRGQPRRLLPIHLTPPTKQC